MEEVHHGTVAGEHVVMRLAGGQRHRVVEGAGEPGDERRWVHAPWCTHISVACSQVRVVLIELSGQAGPHAVQDAPLFDFVGTVFEPRIHIGRQRHTEEV